MAEKKLSSKAFKKSFVTWFFWNGTSQQAERIVGNCFCHAMCPAIEELYDKTEDRADAMKRHLMLFNTEQQVGSIVLGLAIGMEEQLANGVGTKEAIIETKTALIGPTSAIGDSLWVATIIPLLLTICLTLSNSITAAPWIGPLVYLIGYPIGTCIVSWNMFKLGYKSGLEGIQRFMGSGKLDKLMSAATILGLIVIGSLTANFVTCTLNIDIKTLQKTWIDGQEVEVLVSALNLDKLLNGVFPKVVPLGLTLLVYNLYAKRSWKPIAIMGLILALAAVLTAIGYIPAIGAYAG